MTATLPPIDPRCCICGNSYSTRFVCPSCKADPANADWVEGDESHGDVEAHPSTSRVSWGEVEPWLPTALFSDVARRLMVPLTYRAIAAELSCAVAYVAYVAEEVNLCQPDEPIFGRHATTLAVHGMAAAAGAARQPGETS